MTDEQDLVGTTEYLDEGNTLGVSPAEDVPMTELQFLRSEVPAVAVVKRLTQNLAAVMATADAEREAATIALRYAAAAIAARDDHIALLLARQRRWWSR